MYWLQKPASTALQFAKVQSTVFAYILRVYNTNKKKVVRYKDKHTFFNAAFFGRVTGKGKNDQRPRLLPGR